MAKKTVSKIHILKTMQNVVELIAINSLQSQTVYFVNCKQITQQRRSLRSFFAFCCI